MDLRQCASIGHSTFMSGMEMEEQAFTWKINHFPLVRKHGAMINSQTINFVAGQTFGQATDWNVYLREEKFDGKRWIGIFCGMLGGRHVSTSWKPMYFEVAFEIKSNGGQSGWSGEITPAKQVCSFNRGGCGWGFSQVVDADGPLFGEETLAIDVKCKLYTPARIVRRWSVDYDRPIEEFQATFAAKAGKDFVGLLQNPIPCNDIKVVSKDYVTFTVQRGILAARSPVFEAMLRNDMIEAKTGIIPLPDVSGKTLYVLLTYIYSGAIHADWKETEVIPELTNAAAKYQFQDLLQFLNVMMGKVCNLKNVVPLITLAHNLSLKTAEEDLLKFVRDNGASSVENFIEMLKTFASLEALGA